MKLKAPPKRRYCTNRLSQDLREMKPDKHAPVVVDFLTANALLSWGYRHGWETVKRKANGLNYREALYYIWRIK